MLFYARCACSTAFLWIDCARGAVRTARRMKIRKVCRATAILTRQTYQTKIRERTLTFVRSIINLIRFILFFISIFCVCVWISLCPWTSLNVTIFTNHIPSFGTNQPIYELQIPPDLILWIVYNKAMAAKYIRQRQRSHTLDKTINMYLRMYRLNVVCRQNSF